MDSTVSIDYDETDDKYDIYNSLEDIIVRKGRLSNINYVRNNKLDNYNEVYRTKAAVDEREKLGLYLDGKINSTDCLTDDLLGNEFKMPREPFFPFLEQTLTDEDISLGNPSTDDQLNLTEDEMEAKLLKKNIEKIVSDLASQFKEVEDCYRELVQNCIDSETAQIEIRSYFRDIDDEWSEFRVDFEDQGKGMTYFERDNFLLKLFRSSKEDDDRYIGKYGIGISSIFALNLDEVVIESIGTDKEGKKESWNMHLKDISDKPRYSIEEGSSREVGTNVSLTRRIRKSDLDDAKKKLKEKVKFYCERSNIQIFVDDENINKPFDLDTQVKVRKSIAGLEYIVGIMPEKMGRYEFFNNRLKLEEGYSIFSKWGEVTVLASSTAFTHTMSRDSVVKDGAYEKTVAEIKGQIPNLFVKAAAYILESQSRSREIYNVPSPMTIVGLKHGQNIEISRIPSANYILEEIEGVDDLEKTQYSGKKEQLVSKLNKFIGNHEAHSKEARAVSERNANLINLYSSACGFVDKFLKDCLDKTTEEDKKNTGFLNSIKNKIARKSNFYQILSSKLPSGLAKIPLIHTYTHGDISLNQMVSFLSEEKPFYFAEPRYLEEDTIELAKKDDIVLLKKSSGDTYVLQNIGSIKDSFNIAKKIIEHRTRFDDVIFMYSKKIDNIDEISDGCKDVSEAVYKKLPRRVKACIDSVKIFSFQEADTKDKSIYNTAAILFRDTEGRLLAKKGKGVVGLAKSTYRFMTGNLSHSVFLNSDDKYVSDFIELYRTDMHGSREIALNIFAKQIGEKYVEDFLKYKPVQYGYGNYGNYNNPYGNQNRWGDHNYR